MRGPPTAINALVRNAAGCGARPGKSIMSEDIEKLFSVCSKKEAGDLRVLVDAEAATLETYKAGRKASQLRNWNAARVSLYDLVNELTEKYFKKDPDFKNTMAAIKWMQSQGYKIKKSKVYDDVKAGVLPTHRGGRILAADVKAYAATLVKVKDQYGGIDEKHNRKLRAEIRNLTARAEKAEFELQRDMGKYGLVADFKTELGLKISVLDAGIKNWINTRAADIIQAVGGKSEKSRIFIDMFTAELDELFNDFAQMDEINVYIEKGVSND